MSDTTMMNECSRLDRWLTAYLDDELDVVHTLEVEEHLTGCEGCRERVALDRAMRASLRKTRPVASEALRQRAAAALLAEHTVRAAQASTNSFGASPSSESLAASAAEEAGGPQREPSTPKLVRLRHALPFAAAASLAIVAGAAVLRQRNEAAGNGATSATAQANVQAASSFDRFIDELVDAHMQPPPPEVTDDDGLARMNQFVKVRVSRPELTAIGARFLGARMQNRQAALLQYARPDRKRVTLYVFDPKSVPVQATRLEPRLVGEKRLYLGHIRGYAVAASERNGVGYALASDLSDPETEQAIEMAGR